jgi:uncharacterized protein YcbK (DUF882 family)
VPDRITRKALLISARDQAEVKPIPEGGVGSSRLEHLRKLISGQPVMRVRARNRRFSGSRARKSCGLAAIILLIGCNGLQTATADGDTRALSLHHMHTDENITITFKHNGRYDEDALKKLNWFLRDWRKAEETNMDPHLFDLIWEVSREVDAQKPVEVVCGYRSPQTNAMLRRRSGGVARFSQHMLGRAMDFFIPGAPLEDLRVAGLRLQRGGVGYYPTSGSPFVHLDTGSVRHWPRMSREQLARVFPDGRTVHVPSDGHPLQGYSLALADIEKRGNSAAGLADEPKRNLLAALFGARKDKDEDEENDSEAATSPERAAPAVASRQQAATDPKRASILSAARVASAPAAATNAPAATPKQPATYQLASVPTLAPSFAPTSVAQPAPRPRSAAQTTAQAAPEPKLTASIGPWSAISGDSEDESVPADVALAYAAQQQDMPYKPAAARATPMGSVPPSHSWGAATTVLPKSPAALRPAALSPPSIQQPLPALPNPAPTPVAMPAKVGDLFDDPWMRALVLAPDIRNYMTVTSFDAPDFRQLRPMMEKPDISIRMAFSPDPQLGMATDHFSGSAVVFLSTVTFVTRTASLQ